MKIPPTTPPQPQAVGWYGKLPSRGDFLGQGFPQPWLQAWDDWLQRAMADATRRVGTPLLRERLLAMTPWQCIVLPGDAGEHAWHGVVIATADRVGRAFPLLLAEGLDAASLEHATLGQLGERARQMAGWLREAAQTLPARDFEAGAAQWCEIDWPAAPADATGTTLAALREREPSARSFWSRVGPQEGEGETLAEPWPPRDGLLLEWLAVTD